ncbi:hypothetical protein KIN20_002832 [Parelaphostrongylus tenuis]|uniref:Uncharacterized protein n=1 Tax=Parelaphostrongylus tenuis TaxID=148309 RepID=A0AAD5MHD8_PARTN|nr:hypothetical protein KIN20_002832 [Parelaphostrongylus tenuis]
MEKNSSPASVKVGGIFTESDTITNSLSSEYDEIREDNEVLEDVDTKADIITICSSLEDDDALEDDDTKPDTITNSLSSEDDERYPSASFRCEAKGSNDSALFHRLI